MSHYKQIPTAGNRGPQQGEDSLGRQVFLRERPEQQESVPAPEDFSRRDFLKTVGVAAATTAVASSGAVALAAPTHTRSEIIAAIGDTLIPSDPGDHGYKDLESHQITEEVLKALPGVTDADTALF